ncbi:hypothetical protein FRC03_011446 [Tulasnella sp. 419]|nr:hypothetical protein FRC02_005190 [Tulasnella sp. 418]KAG8966698.1 hypothetical protein FRC03_011446 [Tulasnella sp. 419]
MEEEVFASFQSSSMTANSDTHDQAPASRPQARFLSHSYLSLSGQTTAAIMTDNNVEAAGHVETLTSLLNQLSILRLNDAGLTNPTPTIPDQIRLIHSQLQKFSESIATPQTQEALVAASKSEKTDATEIILESEDEARIRAKRRRITQPSDIADGPKLPSARPVLQAMPPEDTQVDGLTLSTLPSFVRSINSDPELPSLNIWLLDRSKKELTDHVTLTSKVPNVLCAYIRLQLESGFYKVRGVVVVGPREKKLPHSHSDFETYRRITQFFSGLLSENPNITLKPLMALIGTYSNLFSDTCVVCGKVLSAEGHHLPPVQRLWEPNAAAQSDEGTAPGGRWVSRHSSCRTC